MCMTLIMCDRRSIMHEVEAESLFSLLATRPLPLTDDEVCDTPSLDMADTCARVPS